MQILAQRANVTIRQDAEVERLLFDDNARNKVTGVVLKRTSQVLTADLVILATGAWTPQLVDLGGIAEATGQVLAYIQISDEEQEQLAHMPTILSFATGIFIIPPRNNELKIARHAYGYRNPQAVQVPVAGKQKLETVEVSIPENGVPVPQEGERACRQALSEMLPAFADRPFIRTRVCWYTDTYVQLSSFFLSFFLLMLMNATRTRPKGDFLITYHPDHPNLFLATGGSGHGYKFLPILGEKIVDAIEGTLDAELARLWKWPEERAPRGPVVTHDGSRSGAIGLVLRDELAKST
jgi:sarcosine oxidase/L-pipecolate oxidase